MNHRFASRMRLVCLLPALLAALGAASPPAAPVSFTVGDPAVDGSFIRPYKREWTITQFTPTGESKDWGTWSDEVQVLDLAGRRVIKRLQETRIPKGTIREATVVEHRTLAPVASEEWNEKGEHFSAKFDGALVRTERSGGTGGGEPRRGEAKLEMPVFDWMGGVYELLEDALPLRDGLVARLPMFDKDSDGMRWQTFTVLRKEKVEVRPGTTVEAWVVETQVKSFRILSWLTREAPYLVRRENHGPRGGHTVFALK